ncbi:hypothetical protein VDG1235_3891 [Verrucomicrobiia bacterium DG1235]|nr:hypothetical protein VDG1235_3891 [Verrucomicrobiae bacterium DG1235]
MPIASTAKKHFDEDLARSRALLEHAFAISEGTLRDDIIRSSWMLSVGAADAFFCDAYADAVARSLQAKHIEPAIVTSKRLLSLKIPVAAVIRGVTTGSWGWRMAARDLIENESVLDLETVRKHFNQYFCDSDKLFGEKSFDAWILHKDWKHRLFGITKTDYRRLTPKAKDKARKESKKKFEERFQYIFQRRHDCIHNCDRAKVSLNRLHIKSKSLISYVIEDIEFLVTRFTEEYQEAFPKYIRGLGYNGTTKGRVCQ